MITIEKEYDFELSQEVKDKIEHTEDRHALIREEDVADLQYVPLPNIGYRIVKRTLDILLSVVSLTILLLPMAVIALAIYMDDPDKVLFRQYRVGREGKRFRFYKFRTMKMDTPKCLSTMEMEDPEKYITRLGSFAKSVLG